MDTDLRRAAQTILVLSPAYLRSAFGTAEWAAVFRIDPLGIERRLLPIRVDTCDVEGLLGPIVHIDLIGCTELHAQSKLLAGVRPLRRGTSVPPFPPDIS